MLHFTGHLQRAQLKTEMQNINNFLYIIYILIYIYIYNKFLGFRWHLMLTIF